MQRLQYTNRRKYFADLQFYYTFASDWLKDRLDFIERKEARLCFSVFGNLGNSSNHADLHSGFHATGVELLLLLYLRDKVFLGPPNRDV